MFDRAESCGVATVATSLDCDTWAKTERPEVASNYECVAALPCGEDESSCDRPTTDFGQRLCDGMDTICGETLCNDELRAFLDTAGGWLKESVQSAGLGCTTQSTCGDAKACFTAWVTAAHL
jgi:hypothetical protein